ERRQHQREAEHLTEEGGQETRVVVEDEVRLVEGALHAAEEADRHHDAERHHEEDGEHQRREDERRVVPQPLGPCRRHAPSTTQASAGSARPTGAPGWRSGRSRGLATATILWPSAST